MTRLSNTKAQKGNARIGVTGSASARSETRAEHVWTEIDAAGQRSRGRRRLEDEDARRKEPGMSSKRRRRLGWSYPENTKYCEMERQREDENKHRLDADHGRSLTPINAVGKWQPGVKLQTRQRRGLGRRRGQGTQRRAAERLSDERRTDAVAIHEHRACSEPVSG